MRPEELDRIAEAIADGDEPDWELADILPPEQQRVVTALRAIGRLVELDPPEQTPEDEAADEVPEMPIGSKWRNLEIREKLGQGAHAAVYRAKDPRLDREVALKLIHSTSAGQTSKSPDEVVREGHLLARVKHPNVATIYGAANDGEQVGIWMELVDGEDLRRLVLARGSLSAREAALVGVDVARACAAVHAQGILHRDIKAQNIMRERGGRIVLMDFGIGQDLLVGEATAEATAPSRDRDAGIPGTPLYLAPEVLGGADASVQSDVYALGVLLYFTVAGSFPLVGGTLSELLRAHRSNDIQPLCDLRPDIPAEFCRIVDRALAHEPSDRFATMGQVERALGAFIGTSQRERRDGRRREGDRSSGWFAETRRRYPRASRAVSILAAITILLLAVYLGSWLAASPVAVPEGARVLLAEVSQPAGAADSELTFVRELLRLQLDQSPYYELVADERMAQLRQQMVLGPSAPLNVQLARHMALRAGSGALVYATMTRVFDTYRLTVTIERVGNDPAIRGQMERDDFDAPSREQILSAIDEAANWIRRELGEAARSRAQVNVPIRDATSPSWPAMQAYLEALSLPTSERPAAISLLDTAIRFDPEFASAHAHLGDLLSWTDLGAAFDHWDEALSLESETRLTTKERFEIESTVALHAMQFERAIDVYSRWRAEFPHDYRPVFGLFYAYAELGRAGDAIAALEASLVQWPRQELTVSRLAEMYVDTGDEVRARQYLATLRSEYGDDPFWAAVADAYEGRLLFVKQDYDAALAVFDRVTRSSDAHWQSRGYLMKAALLGERGLYEEAEQVLLDGIEIDREGDGLQGLEARKLIALAYLAYRRDRPGEVEALVDQALGLSSDPMMIGRAATILCMSGNCDRLVPVLPELDDLEVPLFEINRRRIRGEAALTEGRIDEAIDLFRGVDAADVAYAEREYLARGLEAKGDRAALQESLELTLRMVDEPAWALRAPLTWEVMPGFWGDSVERAHALAIALDDGATADRTRELREALRGPFGDRVETSEGN